MSHTPFMKPFEPSRRSRRGARAEGLDTHGLQPVDQAGHQRRLGPDHHKVDALRLSQRDQPLDVLGGDGAAVGDASDAGIAGRAE